MLSCDISDDGGYKVSDTPTPSATNALLILHCTAPIICLLFLLQSASASVSGSSVYRLLKVGVCR